MNQFFYTRFIYSRLTERLQHTDVVFLNYGYEEDPPMGVPLTASDEYDRLPIQLYHRVATQQDLEGKDVLEVGCGHGGGASYLTRTFTPASYTGLDLNAPGIQYCRKRHTATGLRFLEGDAQNLPFSDTAFDVVINVESSHIYPRFSQFLAEVNRVLRPGGMFLYADLRPADAIAHRESTLAEAPMTMVSQHDITDEVTRGLEETLPRWDRITEHFLPRALSNHAHRLNIMRRNHSYL